ncbi:D-alanyl-D-alanine carboxypeptidase/D-alanyl-D-alanine-endopeptidase [Kamptonema animale CS-326]|jgi:D-alanyl-D-alanine carboxypeptidase/D-alanyl-D-alanine-endopeptidase (penicillin-binding protein 4)|uniref:D-alanyl-D-alanine carboxypeptidase/D-alanyl-D-alanine endopeptidase n=1 Tax=Kamptonema animale TaxID=92934 RepID=UPI00232DDDFC|nr:D-alanyl-D-alanine carboxypeptidase/D-alanyl-D-alanine-endopeptidase [Kamptonema animale]MDB9511681.1 D-alanyl-D-alanine carboxypeptidase/D-alanyl-D-alanine-endopeptidase [Kamptonema animale CS-326]
MKGIAISLLLVITGWPLTAVAQTQAADKICPAQLGVAVDAIANRAQFRRSRWGIVIQTLSTATTLYSRDAQQYFIPASNVKLLTTAAALQKLGPQFRIITSIYGSQKGRLYIVGRGDPSIGETQLKDLAKQLKQRGVNQVSELIADDSYFPGDSVNPKWEWEDVQAGYGAPINSLIFNENAIKLVLSPQSIGQPLRVTFADVTQANQWRIENNSATVAKEESEFVEVGRDLWQPIIRVRGNLRFGSESESVYVSVVNPANNFIQHFRQVLNAEGITVTQALVASNSSPQTQELAAVESPPLADLVRETNQESVNIYAEVLLRLLGKIAPVPQKNKYDFGLQELAAVLTQLGVNPDGYVLADGSGLSRQNLVSPEALVQTLRLMANSPVKSIYRNSLPVAGKSGTLKNRFNNTSAQGIVRAKTGTLTGVAALSGYVEVANFEPLAFSIIINQSDLSAGDLREAIDEIVLVLTRLKRC